MGLDYSYSQPSQDETFGGAETDSEYNEIQSLIQQDQAQLHEALIHQQEALIQQDQAHAFVYPPQPEVEFGFPQICYCGSEPKIATSSIEPVFLAPSSISEVARVASQYLFDKLKPHNLKSPFDELLVDGFDLAAD
ncbi:hypothetical protein Bca52824_072183 [Brassica carinata]|uniref:Uncharacterized protein n=1 Tax=Brassica carinata TaxID=52824 RepID=A0A8X7QCV4_BRACI|nr:hypothetical protein Bca52824_072183 [Brassica carinata]